eukprot:NODE_963_length_2727_cov_0.218798.p2 type:complete len:206 gc:universal NODE_963_length_2727_cov_0.218798:1950-2567(+)
MKGNQNTVLRFENTILAPYKKDHVLKYHEWMKSPELQLQTKSDPLSLSQEYEMQEKWSVDEDKITFIIFENKTMIGDVNLFKVPQFEVDNLIEKFNLPFDQYGELEIMIAEKNYRGKGHAQNSIRMMMKYAKNVGYNKFITRIGCDNKRSLKFFQQLGFKLLDKCTIFKEYLLVFNSRTEISYVTNTFEWFGTDFCKNGPNTHFG